MALNRIRHWLADHGDHALAQRMAGTAFLIRVASAAIAYFSQVLLARWMGSFEFGLYVYVWTWVLLIGGCADLGLVTTTQRFIPEYNESGRLALLRGFLIGSRWLVTGAASIIAVICLGAIWLFSPWLNRIELIPLYLACLCLPFFALTAIQDAMARSFNWVNIGLTPPFILRPLLLVGLMIAAAQSGFGNDARVAMACAVIATWATAIVQLLMLDRQLTRTIEPGPAAYNAPVWLRTSFPVLLVSIFYLMLSYTDIILLQYFRTPDEVAHYYAATKTLALVAFVNFSVASATAHKFAEYHVAGDRERLQAYVAHAVKLTFWPSLAATIVILALGWPFLWLFGTKFVSAYPLMFILALGLLARSALGPAEWLLNMVGEQKSCALVYAGAAAFNIVACVLLIPRLGMYGAAISMGSALICESLLLFLVARMRLGLHVFVWTPRAAS